MIIVICTDDPSLQRLATQASRNNYQTFGDPYLIFLDQIQKTGLHENLFILAHGTKRDSKDRNPVIGDAKNAFFLNAVQFYDFLAPLLPPGYDGSIYISACESYDPGVDGFSFAEALVALIQPRFSQVRVYGHQGGVTGALPAPGNPSYREASRTHFSASPASSFASLKAKARKARSAKESSTMSGMSMAQLDQAIRLGPHALLDDVLTDDNQAAFQDSDGLISFVNMSSSLVTNNPQYNTGRAVCDMISNFFSTLRIKTFGYLQKNPSKILPGDQPPGTQWDSAVTHYMQFLLQQAGGLTNYKVVTETYSVTQVITEFSTAFIKLLFDAATAPEAIITDVLSFIQGVGETLRFSWDDRSRHFSTAILGQCHEAVPVDASGDALVYFPKVKYYYVSVDSSQQAFTSPCTKVEKITFNFQYEYYVTGFKASILDPTSADYKSFTTFLDKAQAISYKQASNNLDSILDGTVSDAPAHPTELGAANAFGVDLSEYPRLENVSSPIMERVLNRRPSSI